jgi:hypothetical protein
MDLPAQNDRQETEIQKTIHIEENSWDKHTGTFRTARKHRLGQRSFVCLLPGAQSFQIGLSLPGEIGYL